MISRDTKGRFIKGHISPLRGKRLTVEHRKKLSDAKKGKPNWRKGVIGKYKHTEEWKRGQSIRSRGRTMSDETKRKISEANRGENNGSWKGGVWDRSFSRGSDYKYRLFRRKVLRRDGCCVFCGSEERLEVDHIKPYSLHPELRLDIENARVLCHSCHKKTETYGIQTKQYA